MTVYHTLGVVWYSFLRLRRRHVYHLVVVDTAKLVLQGYDRSITSVEQHDVLVIFGEFVLLRVTSLGCD